MSGVSPFSWLFILTLVYARYYIPQNVHWLAPGCNLITLPLNNKLSYLDFCSCLRSSSATLLVFPAAAADFHLLIPIFVAADAHYSQSSVLLMLINHNLRCCWCSLITIFGRHVTISVSHRGFDCDVPVPQYQSSVESSEGGFLRSAQQQIPCNTSFNESSVLSSNINLCTINNKF